MGQEIEETPTADVPTISDSTAIMQVIERAAADPNTDVVKMKCLLDMHERILERNAKQAYTEAMVAAQAEMRPVSLDAENPQTRSKYASYVALDQALRPVYSRRGFSLSFDQGKDAPEDHVEVLCYVDHIQGHTRTHRVMMPADGKGVKGGDVMTRTHAVGAANTYGMRYLLKFIFNVAVGEYDDIDAAIEGIWEIESQIKDLVERMVSDKAQELGVQNPASFLPL